MANTILLVDDDALLRRSLAFILEREGFAVRTAADALTALKIVEAERPLLALLDINMPGMSGLDALRHLRERFGVPVIFVTARRRQLDEVLGLELGADDYVTKPFDTDVLLARIRVVLRHSQPALPGGSRSAAATVGDLVVDPERRLATIGDRPVDLSRREFDLLFVLAQEAGRVVSVDELLARVWGAEFAGEPQVVYVHIRWLRQKLEIDPQKPRRILTVRGLGYKLVDVSA